MKDEDKTKEQLINELAELRKQVSELKASETKQKHTDGREWRVSEPDKLHCEIADTLLEEQDLSVAADLILEKIGRFMDVSYSLVFHYSQDREYIDMVCEWHAEDISPISFGLQRIPSEKFSQWNKQIAATRLIHAPNIEVLPEPERQILHKSRIKSVLAVPIFIENRVFGFICLAETRSHRQWYPEEVSFLHLIANIYAIAVKRKGAEERVKEAEQRLRIKLDYLTSSAKRIGDVKLTDLIDVEILQQIQHAFAQAHDVAVVIEDTSGNHITKECNYCKVCNLIRRTVKGRGNCRTSGIMLSKEVGKTLKPALHSCKSIGFLEACVPIIVGGEHIASWFMGQINTMGVTRKRIADYSKEIGSDVDTMLKAFEKMPQMPMEKFEHILSLLWQIAQELSSFAYNNLKLAKEITDHKRADEALRESEQKYRAILENMEEGYYEVDIAGNLTFFNASWCKIFGYTKDELMGMNNREYTTLETAKRIYQIFNAVYRTGKPTKIMEYEIIRKDRTTRVLEMSASLMQDSAGKPIGFRGIARDVTERKRAEEEKKHLQAQLQQAQKIEAIGTLAGGIAHNFNNLLMGIKGNAILMLADTDPKNPHFEKLKIIQKLVRNGSKLTRQLLGYAREGRYEIKPIDLNQLVKEISDTFSSTRKEISIYKELDDDLCPIKADQGQIEQVLLNLYVNAAEAMPQGGDLFLKTMNVTNEYMTDKCYKPKPGNYVLLSLKDTGVGMDKKTLERIFEPFFTSRGLGKGTGLGLASVYGTIKAHGGYIDVYSEKGHGATFEIYLPAIEGKVTKEKDSASELLKGRETVLLVDDDDIVADVGDQMLRKLGYEVLVARSGKETIETYRKSKDNIDMIILDMIMPDMGGGKTYDRLTEINPDVKVLLSSGYSIDGQATEILDRGCNGFIQKPFNMKQLSQRVREVLDR